MNEEPWKDWIPGVLSESQMLALSEAGYIQGVDNPQKSIDHSSFDLHLTETCYEMTSPVKPFEAGYEGYINKKELGKIKIAPENSEFTLTQKRTYVFKLREKLKGLQEVGIFGQATAKSTIGRVDVLARLIVDGMDCYEGFDYRVFKNDESEVDMYLEITPMSFNVKVKKDIPISQLRLFYGNPDNVIIKGKELYKTIFGSNKNKNGSLSLDLSNMDIYDSGKKGCAFSSKKEPINEPIKLWDPKEHEPYDPTQFWDLEKAKNNRLTIEKDRFYIIRSKERISIPPGVAVYCRATDETIGEMRIHYAGFVHPYFGMDRDDRQIGTPLIFEVRGHDVAISLRDKEKMANLIFYRMSEDCKRARKFDCALFHIGEIMNLDEFLTKLTQTDDNLSKQIRRYFIDNNILILQEYNRSKKILSDGEKSLLDGLNKLITSKINLSRLAETNEENLSEVTRRFLNGNSKGPDLIRLNKDIIMDQFNKKQKNQKKEYENQELKLSKIFKEEWS